MLLCCDAFDVYYLLMLISDYGYCLLVPIILFLLYADAYYLLVPIIGEVVLRSGVGAHRVRAGRLPHAGGGRRQIPCQCQQWWRCWYGAGACKPSHSALRMASADPSLSAWRHTR